MATHVHGFLDPLSLGDVGGVIFKFDGGWDG
jgi:hypothetical protein